MKRRTPRRRDDDCIHPLSERNTLLLDCCLFRSTSPFFFCVFHSFTTHLEVAELLGGAVVESQERVAREADGARGARIPSNTIHRVNVRRYWLESRLASGRGRGLSVLLSIVLIRVIAHAIPPVIPVIPAWSHAIVIISLHLRWFGSWMRRWVRRWLLRRLKGWLHRWLAGWAARGRGRENRCRNAHIHNR